MENKKKLIYADEIEELFYKQVECGATDLMDAFDYALEDAQTIDAVEVAHGQWNEVGGWLYYCSCCHSEGERRYNYCPNCGAKMNNNEV